MTEPPAEKPKKHELTLLGSVTDQHKKLKFKADDEK